MIAFVFPGQGSQYPGMARDLTMCAGPARGFVAEAETATGLDITGLMTTGDQATIADPYVAQLLVFVSSRVLLTQLRHKGVEPAMVAGHSLGEYTALVAAGCLDPDVVLRLVAERGAAMAEQARQHPGTMGAVVGLPAATVEELCADAAPQHGTVVIANHNSARQLVVSGTPEAVDAVLEAARGAGALRARRLPVGGAYHSPLMNEAERRLADALVDAPLRPPRVPFVSSVTGQRVTDIESYRAQLLRQITCPVRWHTTVETVAALGATRFVEVGPGRVLSGLDREIVRGARHLDTRAALLGRERAPAEVTAVAGAAPAAEPVAVAGAGERA